MNKSHIVSTDEDTGLRIENFAMINLRGVSTNIKYNTTIVFYFFLKNGCYTLVINIFRASYFKHVKTHKLLQVRKQVVTSLFTSCSQVVFALLVPSIVTSLEQAVNNL